MRKTFKKVLAATLSVCMIASTLFTSPVGTKTVKADDFTRETITKNGFSLTIMQSTDSSKRINGQTLERIKEVYFTQYPKMRARYNPTRPRAVTMKFDPDMDGVAYTGGDMGGAGIKFSVNYLKSNPNDADCATHELFHVVQGGYMNYNSESFEGAICEGIADYARSVYGLYNELQKWSLGEYNSSQTILTRYASNARFLTWINYNKNSEATYMLNKTMHNGTYTADMWVQLTGMTSDQLWNAYAADPNIDKITLSTQKGETFGITQGETYKIISAESGQALSVAGGSTADGANVQQEPYNGDASQQWEFRYLGNGQYNIVNKKSGKGLDVDNGGTANGTNIHQYPVENGGNNNQKWVIFERGNQYSLFPVCGNGVTVADLASSSHNAGANIQNWQWNKSKAQSFIIEPVNGSSDISLSAFNRIEAEDYIEKCTNVNVSIDESEARSGGGNLGGLLAGAWTKYDDVVFDQEASAIEMNYCNPAGDSYVDVYIDNMNGNPVGRIQIPHNSSNWNTYTTIKGDLTTRIPAGTHDVYLSFKNDSMQGYTQNCDYFSFIKYSGPSSYNGFSTINAVEYSEASGIVIDKNSNGEPQNIGGTHNGDWVRYDNVIFDDTVGKIELNYSCQRGSGGQVYVYVDNMDNTPTAMIDISETGSDWKTYKTVSVDLKPTISAGSHTIYLKFVNDGGNVANVEWFRFTEYVETTTPEEPDDGIVISEDVQVEGYQMSTIVEGNRVVGSVEPTINGKTVKRWGLIYGLASANGQDNGITDDDMYVGSEHKYIKSYESTAEGTTELQMGDSTTATYFIRTMKFPAFTSEAFGAIYKIRAYALLENGKYVYSDVAEFSIFSVADYLYQKRSMNTYEAHQYLYHKILKVVDNSYHTVDYEWDNTIVKPDVTE